MKELKKGNKAPYRGFLLNIGEYEKYCAMQKLMPEMVETLEKITKNNGKVKL